MSEYFDLRNEDGTITRQIKERSLVHQDGDLHGTSHVWIVRKVANNKYDILVQKRSKTKDAHPGCYDISSAGHIPAGMDFLESALRELEEELGIMAGKEDLTYIGKHKGIMDEIFYGKRFYNVELSAVYVYEKPVQIDKLSLQESEVESVVWIDFEELRNKVLNKDPEYCIFHEELQLLKCYLERK